MDLQMLHWVLLHGSIVADRSLEDYAFFWSSQGEENAFSDMDRLIFPSLQPAISVLNCAIHMVLEQAKPEQLQHSLLSGLELGKQPEATTGIDPPITAPLLSGPH